MTAGRWITSEGRDSSCTPLSRRSRFSRAGRRRRHTRARVSSFLSLSLSRRSALERRSNRIDSRRVASRRLARRRASRERAREEGRDAPPSRETARDGRDGRDGRCTRRTRVRCDSRTRLFVARCVRSRVGARHVRRDETYLANTPVLLLSASVKNGIDSERKGARRRAKSAARGSIVFFSFVNLSQCQSVKILHLIAHLG